MGKWKQKGGKKTNGRDEKFKSSIDMCRGFFFFFVGQRKGEREGYRDGRDGEGRKGNK